MKTLAIALFTMLAGFAAAVFLYSPQDDQERAAAASSNDAQAEQGSDSGLESRLQKLEASLAREVAARRALEQQLQALFENRDEPAFTSSVSGDAQEAPADSGQSTREERLEVWESRRAEFAESRRERLQEAGFPAAQVDWILQREEELRLQGLYDDWRERRQALLDDPAANGASDPLRNELGEQNYERYLEASGRPTRVRVSRLMSGSPAELAGLQSGDEIVSYGGQRVYDLSDLNAATVQGELGEMVLMDVVRDGSRIQLAVERGPLGIVGRGRR